MFEFSRRSRELSALKKYALPDALWRETTDQLPFLESWAPTNIARLRELSTLFLAEKSIVSGHASLEVTPLMRTLIAAQACALIVNRTLADFDDFHCIVVHPDGFPRTQDFVDEAGVVHHNAELIAGEAWDEGLVLLSWPDVHEGMDFRVTGMNLVIHEFAHILDMRAGGANGVPPMADREAHARWNLALSAAYTDFCARVDSGDETTIDPYASEHESEFFAVCAEVYVAAPEILRDAYPNFYLEMNHYFKLWKA